MFGECFLNWHSHIRVFDNECKYTLRRIHESERNSIQRHTFTWIRWSLNFSNTIPFMFDFILFKSMLTNDNRIKVLYRKWSGAVVVLFNKINQKWGVCVCVCEQNYNYMDEWIWTNNGINKCQFWNIYGNTHCISFILRDIGVIREHYCFAIYAIRNF